MEKERSFQTETDILGYWLALASIPDLGSHRALQLIHHVGSIKQLLTLPEQDLWACGLSQKAITALHKADWHSVEADLRWAQQPDNYIIAYDHAAYPKQLKAIAGAPLLLYIKGDPNVLTLPQVAIVGSRNASFNGLNLSMAFAQQLAELGFAITSGLAIGIDGASHRGALNADGVTVAVLGTGLDNIYPRRHHKLAQQILARGALVSEFPPKTTAHPMHFPRRNRIISGLSLGVLVVEAALRSGSLISARFALEQGREVFAVPGSVHNPMARGCHALLREGATLVETVTDIIEELAGQIDIEVNNELNAAGNKTNDQSKLDQCYSKLLQCLEFEPIPIDIIIERSQMSVQKVTKLLVALELKGLIVAQSGGYAKVA